jgi:hypothetical protein
VHQYEYGIDTKITSGGNQSPRLCSPPPCGGGNYRRGI